MSIKTSLIAALLGVTAVAGLAGTASAETRWGHEHPRQHEVLARAAHERGEIRRDYRAGLISRHRAIRLLRADRRVVREDHALSRAQGGHITSGEQRSLNNQENGIGRQAR
jgi:hypothetical protein